jgi:hypothetical protein
VFSTCAAISKIAPVFIARLSSSVTIRKFGSLKRSQAQAGTLLLLETWKFASTADVLIETKRGFPSMNKDKKSKISSKGSRVSPTKQKLLEGSRVSFTGRPASTAIAGSVVRAMVTIAPRMMTHG